MNTPEHFDAIIVGSGQGGTPLARTLAEAGWKTALIERTHVGGTCINEGCTPTKTMVASGRVAYLAKRGRDYGVRSGEITIEMTTVRQRKRDIVESFRGGSQRRLENTKGLSLIFGEARFSSAHEVEVRMNSGEVEKSFSAERIFINTGTRPAKPRIGGIEQVPILDSTSIMELDIVPEHLLVLGGGYVGLEFGQMFRRFGSEVTIIQRGEQLLGREDQDVAEEVVKIIREDGIEIVLHAEARKAELSGNTIKLTVSDATGSHELFGSHLLVAAGRVPNTEDLNLAAAGVATNNRGFIQVNERLETNVPGVYALGDVNGGPAFTHISYDDFRILRTNLLEGGHAVTTNRLVPYTVFIDPQLGRIGLTEGEAVAQGRNFRIAKMPMSHVARALEVDESRGFMKVIVDAETEQILGCAVLGVEGGEIMAMLQIAMMGKLRFPVLRDAVFAHPTLAEAFNNLFAGLES